MPIKRLKTSKFVMWVRVYEVDDAGMHNLVVDREGHKPVMRELLHPSAMGFGGTYLSALNKKLLETSSPSKKRVG